MTRHLLRRFSEDPLRSVLICGVLGAALALAVASAVPKRSRVALAFTVSAVTRQETADYAYDGYYALRASELVSDTMISWLSTPSVIKEIYAAADHDVSDARAEAEAGRVFRARKFSSQNVAVTFSAPDAATAAALARAATLTLSAKADGLALSPSGASLFAVTAGTPVIVDASVPPRAAGAAGAALGLFAGFALAYVARGKKNP